MAKRSSFLHGDDLSISIGRVMPDSLMTSPGGLYRIITRPSVWYISLEEWAPGPDSLVYDQSAWPTDVCTFPFTTHARSHSLLATCRDDRIFTMAHSSVELCNSSSACAIDYNAITVLHSRISNVQQWARGPVYTRRSIHRLLWHPLGR